MPKGISIKIDGKWVEITQDSNISIEMKSPVLNDEGTFSLPFELPYEPNRNLFGSIGETDGADYLRDIDGKSFELYMDDVLLYYGAVETDDEEEIMDTIPLNFVSGNSLLKDMIEGMKASDVEVKDKIEIGYSVGKCACEYNFSGNKWEKMDINLDTDVFMKNNTNISVAYPGSPYCNVRVCYQPSDSDEYQTLEADRPWSGICFYVPYFLDCLFEKLGLAVSENPLLRYEDFKRLAFFNTKCECDTEETNETLTYDQVKSFVPSLEVTKAVRSTVFKDKTMLYANSKNFPDEEVQTIIDSIQNGFGVRMCMDQQGKKVNMYMMNDIFTDSEVLTLECTIIEEMPKHYKKRGIIVKYTGADDKDTAYNYHDWNNANLFTNYRDVITSITNDNMNLYVNQVSGKTFRVKVNKDAEKEEDWWPSLFEVAQFNEVKIGDCKDDECEELEIGFSPVIMNDVNFKKERYENVNEQVLAAFLDVDMLSPQKIENKVKYYMGDSIIHTAFTWIVLKAFGWEKKENYDRSTSSSSPLRSFNAGFTLGIMRGPGNTAGLDYYLTDYDGNGNDAWTTVPANYAFDEDYITNWNQVYDYNGIEPGVQSLEGMFSLKLRAAKTDFPIDSRYAGRGLVDKFLSEYAYFLANHKAVIITARLEVSQLINLKWEKRYRIGKHIGYINSMSYSISNNGISDVTIELFTI